MRPHLSLSLCLALSFSAAAAGPAAGQDLPALHDATAGAADESLNLRAEPDPAAAATTRLPADARGVEVVALSANGAWGLVGLGEFGGWVAMDALVRQPGQRPWWQMESTLLCRGTEPNWSLGFSTTDGSATLTTPDPPALAMQVRTVWPGRDWLPQAGVTLSGAGASATLALTGGECFDGMSDRTYGIAATLFLTGALPGDGPPLTGCCTLSAL